MALNSAPALGQPVGPPASAGQRGGQSPLTSSRTRDLANSHAGFVDAPHNLPHQLPLIHYVAQRGAGRDGAGGGVIVVVAAAAAAAAALVAPLREPGGVYGGDGPLLQAACSCSGSRGNKRQMPTVMEQGAAVQPWQCSERWWARGCRSTLTGCQCRQAGSSREMSRSTTPCRVRGSTARAELMLPHSTRCTQCRQHAQHRVALGNATQAAMHSAGSCSPSTDDDSAPAAAAAATTGTAAAAGAAAAPGTAAGPGPRAAPA